jgi:uncharacterized repeat protein (TIGR01451 family)
LALRGVVCGVCLGLLVLVGFAFGRAQARTLDAPSTQAVLDFSTLRLHGYPALGHPDDPPYANRPATAGSNSQNDPISGLLPEDAPYTEGQGPFDPLSGEAPEMDFATWDPAWISERLGDSRLQDEWPGLTGMDEVSAASNIRADGVNASEKVWLRHWYEPQHLDRDINADGRLTSDDEDDQDYGVPDAPSNPTPSNIDEWYPAIMTEFTYMFVDNDPLPVRDPAFDEVHRSAPRGVCARAGRSRMIFPVGISAAAADPAGPAEGQGLTSLDADFDGTIDMINLADEATLPSVIGGTQIDFDGDGLIETANPDGVPLSCDELVVMHTDQQRIAEGERLQFLDHYVEVNSVAGNSAVLDIYYTGDLVPRLLQRLSVGIGSVALSGDTGPLQVINSGGTNLGSVPRGPWFVYVQDVDSNDDSAILTVGRALGAPCASMQRGPSSSNLLPGTPYWLKRFYVDGHEYNTVAIYGCDSTRIQYITLRAPLPKVPVTIEAHSVRLQDYAPYDSLTLIPPFNYEHTLLEDIVQAPDFENITDPVNDIPRPIIHYMGGPVGPIPPVLGPGDAAQPYLPYVGRDPSYPVGPYENPRSTRWLYTDEDVDPAFLGELREKMGAPVPDINGVAGPSFFYNEQMFTLPWNFTEFVLPDQDDPPDVDPDNYLVTLAFTNPTSRWRRWLMPNTIMPDEVPPSPPDLIDNIAPDGGFPTGAERRAAFHFDPDDSDKIFYDSDGVKLYGGQPEQADPICNPDRPGLQAGAGDLNATDPQDSGLPIEVAPYTDPFAPFNPQHPFAPRGDLLTFNPAYMDEFRNFDEALRQLYSQISNDAQNAREKVYNRTWYEPDYTTKIRFDNDCTRDLRFPAVMQEYTYAYLDMTDNPDFAPAGSSRFGFPIGTRADELPRPNPGGTLPAGGEFGYGLTTFDGNFDGRPDAVTIHSEQTLATWMDGQWQANRPRIPGFPPPVIAGPRLDFDGDGILDDLDQDGQPLTGDEMVVFALTSIELDLDPNTTTGSSVMVLDHLVTLENVTRGSRAQLRFWFTGGSIGNARPEPVGGSRSLNIGDAAIVDRFQNQVTIISPPNMNVGPEGGWFAFVESVDQFEDRVLLTVGRALGATHSAIDDGNGEHDLLPGDPWYLKRFYVDGHEYNAVAIMTQASGTAGTEPFGYITIRTPVPKGNFFNSQESLFQQGYFLDGLPAEISVMPPFNVDHTIARDISRIDQSAFADPSGLLECTGPLEPSGPLVTEIRAEEPEPHFGTELREIWSRQERGLTWETDQHWTTPWQYTEISVPDGQQYLLTLNWTSPVSRLAFYGCLPEDGGPFPEGDPGIDHQTLADIAEEWTPDDLLNDPNDYLIIPDPNRDRVVEVDNVDVTVPYYDARIGDYAPRVKLFYDPTDANDPYVNTRPVTVTLPSNPGIVIRKVLRSADPAFVGSTVVFDIVVFNTGDTALTDVDITDFYSQAYLAFQSATIPPTSVAPPGTLSWNNIESNAPGGSFDPGEQILITVRFTALANTPDGQRASNRARVTALGGLVSNGPSMADLVVGTPGLEVDKQLATSDPATIGSTMSFTVTLQNTGTVELTDVDLTDSFDTIYMNFLSASILPTTINEPGGILTWNNLETSAPGGTFDPGETIILMVNFTATAATPDPTRAENTVSATALGGQVLTGTVTEEVEINPPAAPSIQVVKRLLSANPTTVGMTVTFEIMIVNNGNTTLTDVDLFDTFPAANLSFASASIAPTNVNVGTMEWQNLEGNAPGGSFDPGESFVINVNFTAIAATTDPNDAVNSAEVFAEGDTVTDGPSTASVEIDPPAVPSISIDKQLLTASETTTTATVSFRITLTNDGNTVLTDVDVSDTYDTLYLDLMAASLAPSAFNEGAGTIAWNNVEGNAPGGTFDPGESIIIDVDFEATGVTPDPDRARNVANVSANAGTVLAGPAQAEVEIEERSIQISKELLTANPTTVGSAVSFRITLTNNGSAPLVDVNVTDNFDTVYLDHSSNSVPASSVDEGLGQIIWSDIESAAPGGTFDPGESIVIDVNFVATQATTGAPANNSVEVATNGGSVTAGPASASVAITAVLSQLTASCQSVGDRDIRVAWTDVTSGESEFQIQASVDGSGFMQLATDPSASIMETGSNYGRTFDTLLPGKEHNFRVRARNPRTGVVTPWSAPSTSCATTPMPATQLGCVEGTILAQGRTNHAGLPIYVDGAPAATSGPGGHFRVCGIPEGSRKLISGGSCYLRRETQDTEIEGGVTTSLPKITLLGGDINDDNHIDIFDLVRVGADFRSQPPNDEMADCTGDGVVNIFDLVLVGVNYDLSGPLAWALPAITASQAGPAHLPFLRRDGQLGDGPFQLRSTEQDDGTIEVEVIVRSAKPLYGADFTLHYDVSRLKAVVMSDDPVLRMEVGSDWATGAFIARNQIDESTGTVRFAASLRKPADPLSGEILLATLHFRPLVDEPGDEAYAITKAQLSDPLGYPIEVSWTGTEIEVPLDREGLSHRIFLPFTMTP